ncbi:uncharacterized protein LOC143861651 isoform X3 [Tasmannia lanceolata]|uniref:uncharacterized protein LOC143861651 isoform X3 n=1 Tax=Tasmannia lanceolata TaxID=3420 RepID=UPI0040648C14
MGSSCNDSSWDDDGSTQQLQILQSLVPNISNVMDEKSILEETRNYLERIKEETEQIEKELSQQSKDSNSSGIFGGNSSTRPLILGVETEKLTEGSFVVKMNWRKGKGVSGHVQRLIECLEVTSTSVLVTEKNAEEMFSTAFLQKNSEMTPTLYMFGQE